MELEVDFCPRPEYGLVSPRMEWVDDVLVSRGGADVLCLSGPARTEVGGGRARWRILLEKGERCVFALRHSRRWDPLAKPWSEKQARRRLDDTATAWRSWSELHQRYQGPAQDLVHLSGRCCGA